MKKYTVELTEEQLKQLGIKVEPEFTYPLVKRWVNSEKIVKFTSMTKGTTVWGNSEYDKVGYTSDGFTEHTDSRWEDVAYDSERGLWDKQPVECWDNENTHRRYIGFYDAENRWTFDNYKAIPSDRYDEWILDAYKTLVK